MRITNIRCFVLMMIIAIVLTGCSGGGVTTPVTDEAKIKSVINEYALALNDQNWNKAKNYCVYASDTYYSVELKEDAVQALYQYCNVVTLTYNVTINNVLINESYAEANISVQSIISACGYFENFNVSQIAYLQKIGNIWKIYGSSQPIQY